MMVRFIYAPVTAIKRCRNEGANRLQVCGDREKRGLWLSELQSPEVYDLQLSHLFGRFDGQQAINKLKLQKNRAIQAGVR